VETRACLIFTASRAVKNFAGFFVARWRGVAALILAAAMYLAG
jgi:hypothetical protein